MIIKNRNKSDLLQKLEALLRRLPNDHTKIPIIKKDYAKSLAGYKGERSIDYPLSFLPQHKYSILHDLRLFDGSHYFQIDTLIVSSSFVTIIEVKNISGTLVFDQTFNQLIRINENREEAFPNPIIQVKRHVEQLEKWRIASNIQSFPIEPLVVIGNERAVIKASNKSVSQIVLPQGLLTKRIMKFEEKHKVEENSSFNQALLIEKLLCDHIKLSPDILQRYQIPITDLQKGVQCSHCSIYSMRRIHGGWVCEHCSFTSKNAHLQALKDYSLLISSEITNLQARDFLHINSIHTTKRILNSKKSKGYKKGKSYFLD
ncbi:NERD domain-containing protein [Peribacillus alkalitolerans]|uniref:NERD domain-containing protein n=1 Tax=Peribacillus alkalitolerans TaxID=1550385 RepID=UPI0013D2D084|nr:NERD domain-containing protein [Peribacillus alkalitolerans]